MFVDVEGRAGFVHTGAVGWAGEQGGDGGDGGDGGVGGVGHDSGQHAHAGHAVVLVHGAGNDHTVWRYQTRLLSRRGVAVLAVDLPGHGRSDGPARDSVPASAAWVLALLTELGVSTATVVGHSMGSLIALAAADAAPSVVGRIALVATSPTMGVHPDLLAAAEARSATAVDMIVGWSHTAASRFGGHAQAGVWTTAQTRRLLERNLDSLATDLRACTAFDGSAAAARVAAAGTDALVIAGASDLMTPARAGREMATALGAAYTEIPGGSHVSLYDHPAQVNAALLPFVETVAAASP